MRVNTRGASSLLGVVLLLSLVMAAMAITVAVGVTALDQTKEELGTARAEKTMTQFDSKAAVVALGQSNSQGVTLAQGSNADYQVKPESAWMNVSITNTTSNEVTTVVNVTLGAVVYENEQARLAYQGGGVWKKTGSGATMVSPPEFHWRNATLTLPIIAVDGQPGLGGRAQVTRNGSATLRYPNATVDRNFTNPLENGKVNVTVRSEYYRAWGRYFEQRTDGEVDYDHDDKTATIILKVPAGNRKIKSAVTSTAGAFSIAGNGARTDSYDSRVAPYPTSLDDEGNITIAGDVSMQGTSSIVGDVISGGEVTLSGTTTLDGDAYWTDDFCKDGSATMSGTDEEISGVETDGAINSIVDNKTSFFSQASHNDNDATDDDIESNELELDGDNKLGPGNYFVKNIDMSGETLTLEPNGDTIVFAVKEYIRLESQAEIEVSGKGQVKFYVGGDDTVSEDVGSGPAPKSCSGGGGGGGGPPGGGGGPPSLAGSVVAGASSTLRADGLVEGVLNNAAGGGAHVAVVEGSSINAGGDDNSTQVWIYGKGSMNAEIGKKQGGTKASVTGAIYAPANAGGGSGTVNIKHGQVFGAAVANTVNVHQGGEVHFDEALAARRAVPKNAKIVSITYLHISVNRVNVTSA